MSRLIMPDERRLRTAPGVVNAVPTANTGGPVCPKCGKVHPPTTNARRFVPATQAPAPTAGGVTVPGWVVNLAQKIAANEDKLDQLQAQLQAQRAGSRPAARTGSDGTAQPLSLIKAIQERRGIQPAEEPTVNSSDGIARPLSLIEAIQKKKGTR